PAAGDGRCSDDPRCAARVGSRILGDRSARRCGCGHPARGARRVPRLLEAGGVVTAGIFSTPRPVPSRFAPTTAAGGLIVLALPVFAVADWPLSGWLLATVLWAAALAFSLLLARL